MNDIALPSKLEMRDVIAAEVHELKNQLGQLTLSLDELSTVHPVMVKDLHEPRHICRIVADSLVRILTMYKSESGHIRLNLEAHSPKQVLDELSTDTQSLLMRDVEIVISHDLAPPFAFFDRYLVEIALSNALHNASRFAMNKIELGARSDANGIFFFVRDDSSGFPEHILNVQGHKPIHSETGTGLGLYFAQTIAKAHCKNGICGELRLENQDGAIFGLWLP